MLSLTICRLQIPDQPRATALLIHGCASGAYNFWPQSDACPGCRGLPEQMSHVVQALQRGYAGGKFLCLM